MATFATASSDFLVTRVCSPEVVPLAMSRRWRVLRAFIKAFVRFKRLQADVVKDLDSLLLSVERSPNPRKHVDRTILDQAISNHRRTAQFFGLICSGSSEDLQVLTSLISTDPRRYLHDLADRHSLVNAKNIYGHTPLYEAALHGHVAVVKLLLDNSADVHLPSSVSSTEEETPLEVAVRWNHLHVAEFLLQVSHFSKSELARALKLSRSDVIRRRLKTFKPSRGICCGRSK